MKLVHDEYVVGDSTEDGEIVIQDDCGRVSIFRRRVVEDLINDLAQVLLRPTEDKVHPRKSFQENGR